MSDDRTVWATNPPSMFVHIADGLLRTAAGVKLELIRADRALHRIDLIAERDGALVLTFGEPAYQPQRPPLPAGCEFLAYVHVHRALTAVMDCHIETDVPVYQEDR